MRNIRYLTLILLFFGCSPKEYPQVIEHYQKNDFILKGLVSASKLDYVFQYSYSHYYQDTFLMLQKYGTTIPDNDIHFRHKVNTTRTIQQIVDSLNSVSEYWSLTIESLKHPRIQEELAGLSPYFTDLLQVDFPTHDIIIFNLPEYVYWQQILDVGTNRDELVEYYLIKKPEAEVTAKTEVISKAVLPFMQDEFSIQKYDVGRINDSIHYRVLK